MKLLQFVTALHTSLVEAIFPTKTTRNCFVEAREKDGKRTTSTTESVPTQPFNTPIHVGSLGVQYQGHFLGHQGFSYPQKKQKKICNRSWDGTLISMLGTRLARTSISCSTSAVFGSVRGSQSSPKNGRPKTPRGQKIPHGIV